MAKSDAAGGIDVTVRDRAYDDMGSVLGLDPSSIDPNKHYRWVNRTAVKVARAKIKGYTIVPQGAVKPLVEVENGPDSSMIAGDLVLMSIDKGAFVRRKKKEHDLTLARTQQAGEDTLQHGEKLGIKTIREISDE